jgi:Dolichyl-phosphate-mannose-protein mannosyltransferase
VSSHVHVDVSRAHRRPAAAARPRSLELAALFVGALLISGFTILRGGAEFDEGVVLQTASRIADGELLYGDLLWAYGPAQPYLLAGFFELFGPSMMSWRVPRVLCDAAVAVTVYALVRRDAPEWLALFAWLTAACAMAQPMSANPLPYALLLALLAFAVATREPATRRAATVAGVLIGLTAAWRPDVAVYAGAAVAAALLLRPERRAWVLPYAGVALGVGLLAYLPFLVAVGPSEMWEQLVAVSLREKEWWSLPFPVGYDAGFATWPPGTTLEHLKDVLGFYVPLLVVMGLALVTLVAVLARLPWKLTGLVVLGLGVLSYLLARPDEFHAPPLIVVLAVAVPLAVPHAPRMLGLAALAVLALLLAYGASNRLSALVQPPELDTIHVAVADGAKATPRDARGIERMVATVQRLVPPGEPIYAATRRSDLVAFNDPIIYVLTDRPNATGIDFGLLAKRSVQERIVAGLRRERPRAIVRWLDPISVRPEPNKRGRSTGVRLVDRYLADSYRTFARYGDYQVLVPRR